MISKLIDPILEQHKSISADGYQYGFVSLDKYKIKVVAAYTRVVWDLNGPSKSISPLDVIENAKTIFKSDKVRGEDVLWMEHCAASLRELVDGTFEGNSHRTLRCLPKRGDSEQKRSLWEAISRHGSFLNDMAHLRSGAALVHAREILGEKDLDRIEEKNFDKICTSYIDLLHTLYKHCMK